MTVNDSAITDQNTASIVSAANGVLGNDTDPYYVDSKTVVAVNGSAALVGVPTAFASALLTVNADGATPMIRTVRSSGWQRRKRKKDLMNTISDGAGERSAAAVTITVTGLAADAPALGAGDLSVGAGRRSPLAGACGHRSG